MLLMRPLVVAALLLSGCAAAEPQLTETERAVASAAGIDATVAVQAKSLGTSIERLLATTKDYDEAPAAGILVNTQPKSGRAVLTKLREQFAGTPYRAYLREDSFGTGPDKVAITRADDLGYLAMVRTDGVNYDIEHEKVLERYQQWDKKYGLQLVGAGQDWLEAHFVHPPDDWKVFAKEVYAFCPDVVDQGTGTVDALAKEMQSGNLVFLWWD
jgi:hypothetical protein